MRDLTDQQLDDIWNSVPDDDNYSTLEEAERGSRLKYARLVLWVATTPESEWVPRADLHRELLVEAFSFISFHYEEGYKEQAVKLAAKIEAVLKSTKGETK